LLEHLALFSSLDSAKLKRLVRGESFASLHMVSLLVELVAPSIIFDAFACTFSNFFRFD
jgi:hypothetical protein